VIKSRVDEVGRVTLVVEDRAPTAKDLRAIDKGAKAPIDRRPAPTPIEAP
jgi:hypothetical protein